MKTSTIVIADDHLLFREGLSLLFERDDRLEIVGHAASGDEAIESARSAQPDVLLLDLSMPGVPAHISILAIRRASPRTRVVVLTMHDDPGLRTSLLGRGASGYWSKSLPSREIIDAVVVAAAQPPGSAQGTCFSESSPEQLVSPREAEVLFFVSRAMSNRQIAVHLGIAEGTVKRHLSNIFDRLDAVNRLDAVHKASRLGILALAAR